MPIVTASLASTIVGTGINTPPADLVNTLNATTPVAVLPVVADQWSNQSPFLSWMTRRGKLFRNVPQLIYALATAEDPSGGSYYGLQIVAPAAVDNIQPATQVWRPMQQPMAIPITDLILNIGVDGAIDILTEKATIAATSLLQKMSRALYHVAPQNTSLDIDDIDSWVGATTNVIAGIDRSQTANAFWKPTAPQAVGGVLTTAALNTAYQSTINNFDEADVLVMDSVRYGNFVQPFFSQIRFNDAFPDEDAVQVGLRRRIKFNNALILQDRNIPTTGGTFPKGYLLNTRYFQPAFHPLDYFTMDPFIKSSNQRALVTALYVTWQLVCFRPVAQIALTGLS